MRFVETEEAANNRGLFLFHRAFADFRRIVGIYSGTFGFPRTSIEAGLQGPPSQEFGEPNSLRLLSGETFNSNASRKEGPVSGK